MPAMARAPFDMSVVKFRGRKQRQTAKTVSERV